MAYRPRWPSGQNSALKHRCSSHQPGIRDTPTEHKKRFGNLAYLWSAAKHLAGFQPRRFTLEVDGRAIRTHASAGVRLWFFLQDMGTLEEHYPGTAWHAFLNTSVKQFFGVDDPFTADLVVWASGTLSPQSSS